MLNVALIGIGNIGLLFDDDKNIKNRALSHIKAIYLNDKFNLQYVVDIDDTHLKKVKKFFPNALFTKNYKKLVKKKDIDILVIATPTNTHYTILNDFKNNTNIKKIFVEKPLFNSYLEYKNIDDTIKNKIVVNYLRRFDKNINKLKKEIHKNKYGDIQKIVINYCKGFKNNGSHMIDMINFLFDNPTIISSQILSHTKAFNKIDLTYDIFIELKYNNKIIPLYFLGLDHTLYNIIEHNIYCENKIIKYINSKSTIEYYDIIPDKNFHQYKVSSDIPIVKKVKTTTLMLDAYNELNNIIHLDKKNISSYTDEIANSNFLEKILKGS